MRGTSGSRANWHPCPPLCFLWAQCILCAQTFLDFIMWSCIYVCPPPTTPQHRDGAALLETTRPLWSAWSEHARICLNTGAAVRGTPSTTLRNAWTAACLLVQRTRGDIYCSLPPPPFSWAAFVTGNLSSFLYSFLSLQLSSLPVSGRRRRRGGGVMPCSKQLYWHLNWMWITVIIQPSCFLAGIQRWGGHQCAAASQAGGHKATHARIHTALARIGIHPLRHDTHAPRRAHRSAHGWRREWSSLLWVPGPVETAM